jgi:hypothetical protein
MPYESVFEMERFGGLGDDAGQELGELEFEQEIGSRNTPEYRRWVQASLNQLQGSGLVVDGVIGRNTRSAIRAFQRRHQLIADGIVGPLTEAALIRTGARPPPTGSPSPPVPQPSPPATRSVIRRVWAFSMGVPNTVDSQKQFLKKVSYLQLSDVAFMVNSNADAEFQLPAARSRAVTAIAQQLKACDIDTHLVTWLRPTETYMTQAAARLRDLCTIVGARSLMFDVEEPWTKDPSLQGDNPEAAARAIVGRYWRFTNWPCPLGVTGITYLPAAVKPIAERCGYVLPQAYSVQRAGRVYEPGVTQTEAHKRWRGFGKPIVMGLAAYRLNRPGNISEEAAMQKAMAATQALIGPTISEAAYWSLEWLKIPGARVAFVRQAAIKARQGVSQIPAAP